MCVCVCVYVVYLDSGSLYMCVVGHSEILYNVPTVLFDHFRVSSFRVGTIPKSIYHTDIVKDFYIFIY